MPTNLLMGVADSRAATIVEIDSAGSKLSYPGLGSFIEFENNRAFNVVWLGPGSPKNSELLDGPIINTIVDPDVCAIALKQAASNAERLNRPWFNHPTQVLKNTRDGNYRSLTGIVGLRVPKVTRVTPKRLFDVDSAVRAARHKYPVLVRPVGEHNGKSLVKLNSAKELEKLLALPWAGCEYYITDFVSFASPDGFFRKYRIAVIGGVPYLRHLIISDHWKISTAADRLWNEKTISEEKNTMERFDCALGKAIAPAIAQMYRRLRLDFFGIDCSVSDSGEIVLFEVNAAMLFFQNIGLVPDLWGRQIEVIRRALASLLDEPSRWTFHNGLEHDSAPGSTNSPPR